MWYRLQNCGGDPLKLSEGTLTCVESDEATPAARTRKPSNDGVKRLHTFTHEEAEKLDRKKVKLGQFGTMVTLGCYAHCKVSV